MYGKLPISFERNQDQTDEQVQFRSRGSGYTLFLTRNEAVLALKKSGVGSQKSGVSVEIRNSKLETRRSRQSTGIRQLQRTTNHELRTTSVILRMQLVGANSNAPVRGVDELPGKSNYFIGDDPGKWRTNVARFAKVKYEAVYPGVDLVYYGNQGRLEYDFVVAPGGDPRRITLGIALGDSKRETRNWKLETGNSKLRTFQSKIPNPKSKIDSSLHIAANGDIVVPTDGGEVRFHKPGVYQNNRDGSRRYINGRYVLGSPKPKSENLKSAIDHRQSTISFHISAYDRTRPLVIDPVLVYSTYLGGANGDVANAIAVDGSGNVYVAGTTASTNFPTAGPEQSSNGGNADAFVTKLDSTGSKLVYSTYLGGSAADQGIGVAVDSSGNAYVTGTTSSANFPTTKGTFQTTYGGSGDAFVAKLNPAGSMLVYSSYLGGSGADFGQSIAVDPSGSAYVTGSTQSANFPTASPLQAALGGDSDAFVAKVNATGSSLTYSTYLGGSAADSGQGIAIDSSGNAYVAGFTTSANFPVTAGALQTHCGGFASGSSSCPASDAFVTKLNSAGSGLVYSTYLGGSGIDRGFGVALDRSDNVYVTGDTQSNDFPTTAGAVQTVNGGNDDAFVSKLNSTGTALLFSSFLGGGAADQGSGIAVDPAGFVYVTGFTQSSNFPTRDPLQSGLGGGSCSGAVCSDAFVSKVDSLGSSLIYSTYLGGAGADFGQAVAVDSSGNAYVAGSTVSTNFPATGGTFQSVLNSTNPPGNAFVTKVEPNDLPAVSLSPQQINFGNPGTGAAGAAQTVTLTNAGSAPLNVTGVSVSGDFAETNNCVGTVAAAGGTCTISVTLGPTATKSSTGSVSITDDAAGSPQQVALTGTTPAAAVTFSPTSLTFPTETVGVTSPAQSVTLTNSGSAALSITKIAIAGDYSQSNNCGSSLAVGASCSITVTFKPTGTGNRSGTLSITDNAAGSPQNVTLAGTGNPVFSLTADTGSVTINIGTSSTSFTVSASGAVSGTISLACANTSGATCTFNPTSIKTGDSSKLTVSGLTGTSPNPLGFTVNGTSGAQTAPLSLTINFADFSVSAVGSDGVNPVAAVSAGQTASYTVSVTPLNGFNQSVSLSCAYLTSASAPQGPAGSACSVSPTSVKPNGSTPATATMSVKTTSHSLAGPRARRVAPPPVGGPERMLYVLGLLALVTLAAAIRHHQYPVRVWVGAGVLTLLVLAWTACNNYGSFGGFSEFGGIAQKGTPSGNYILAITGTLGSGSGAVTRSATVNLSVN